MPGSLDQIPDPVWASVADRMNAVGVFANEDRSFLPEQILVPLRIAIGEKLRRSGYVGGPIASAVVDAQGTGADYVIYDTGRFSENSAQRAWQADYRDRWHDRVSKRVADWQRRLLALREQIATWISEAPDLQLANRRPVKMYEELMRKFDVSPVDLEAYEIVRGTERLMRVQPKGLFVIGANGRVDFTTKDASVIVVDASVPFSSVSNWEMYQPTQRRSAKSLTKENLFELIGYS